MSGSFYYSVFSSFVIYLSLNSVLCYENVYDLLESRNQRLYQPYRRYETSESFNYDDRNHYYNQNRGPYPSHSYFGNGYDNLGNGIPNNHFHSIRHNAGPYRSDWRFDQHPFLRRGYNDRLKFVRFPEVRNDHRRYEGPYYYHHREYYPQFEDKSTSLRKSHNTEYGERGDYDVSKVDRFLEDNENKKHKKTDEVFQQNHESTNTDLIRKEKTGERSHTDQLGENKSSLRSNKVLKKGHTTKGFASHHHKDETGNSTTFFDEYTDFGGQSDFKDIADGFATKKTLEQISNTGNEKFYRESGGQAGNYGSGLTIGNQKFEKDFSSGVRHSDEALKFNQGSNNEKQYHYLNGDKFDFSEPLPQVYY